MKKQGLGIAVVAVWMLVLALVVGDAASTTEPVATLVTPTMPSVADADAPTSTWFCAASSAAVSGSTHQVELTNPTDEVIEARVTAWSDDGAAAQPRRLFEIGPRSAIRVGADEIGGGGPVMAEFSGGGAAASHRVSGEGLTDEGPCASDAFSSAHFPAIDTRRGASARLWIFNPFPADVVIDGTVSSDDAVRNPGALTGFVVRAGTATAIDLGEIVQRREQFAVSLEARSGRFVAELAQTGDGTESPVGIRLQLGATDPVSTVVFPLGLVTAGLTERYVLYNPGTESVVAVLGVLPFDIDPASLPEPFEIEVPPRRAVSVQLHDEPRVPPDSSHWVRVHVAEGDGIVAERVVTVTGTNSLGLTSGTASSLGSAVGASRWLVPGLHSTERSDTQVSIVNPSIDTIAVVQVTPFVAGQELETLSDLEVAPGNGVIIDLGPIFDASPPDALVTLEISTGESVVVAKRARDASSDDLVDMVGLPFRSSILALPLLAEATIDPADLATTTLPTTPETSTPEATAPPTTAGG